MTELVILGLLIIILLVLLYFSWQGAPFVPTNQKVVEAMVKLAEVKPGDKAVDLGSGDGRLVIALAQAGAEAHGYEINPLLVLWARRRIKKAGLASKAFIHLKSFWSVDLSVFNIVTFFGIPYILNKLEKKLSQELKPGARVASHAFALKSWNQPVQHQHGVYLYMKDK